MNESVERRHFRQRRQQPGESFDDFLVSLRELAKTCNFCTDECTQKSIRDQIVEGLLDGDAIEDLLKERELTLDATILKCRAQEAAKQQREEITSTPAGNSLLQTVQKTSLDTSHKPPSTVQKTSLDTSHKPPSTCPGCGAGHHPGGRQNCPAYQATCRNCNKTGHFARVCRSR